MKKILSKFINKSPELYIWLIPILIIIPNIVLDITEQSHVLAKAVNIVLPLGVYLVLMGLSRKVGRTGLLMFPFMFFAAFQIVLIYLYGESIIAIDMFLNVATTSFSEATELLNNLVLAILTVVVLYIPPIVMCIAMLHNKKQAKPITTHKVRKVGYYAVGAGILLTAISYFSIPGFKFSREVFPINVIDNMFTAINRAIASNNFANTSANFSYNATSTHAQSEREIYVLVIGETSRADNWQIFGYDRPTNPLLSRRDSLISFPKALSESNTTHKSVPLMLSWVDNSNFGDSIYTSKSILEAFNEAGFNTVYLSNQGRNHSFIDFFAEEADTVNFLRDDGANHFDHELIEPFKNFIKQSKGKVFVVLHTYGSHFNYKDRYPREFAKFQPDESTSATVENLDQLINAYDNTIVYTDALLDNIIATLASQNCPAAVLYLSDHGEDIFDDSRHRFLHASPVPTYYQIHVPVVMWMSPKYTAAHPEKYTAAESHKDMDVSSSGIAFDTMLDLAGIATSYADPTKSLVSNMYKPTERRYLNDYNEGVALSASGLRHYDFENLKHKNISAN